MKNQKKNPIRWVPTTYFAIGLPFVMLSLVSPIFFKDFGIPNEHPPLVAKTYLERRNGAIRHQTPLHRTHRIALCHRFWFDCLFLAAA